MKESMLWFGGIGWLITIWLPKVMRYFGTPLDKPAMRMVWDAWLFFSIMLVLSFFLQR